VVAKLKVSIALTTAAARFFDITKLDDRLVRKIAEAGTLDKAMEDVEASMFLTCAAAILGCAKKGKESLSEEELAEEVEKLYLDVCLEYLVRKGCLERLDKWSYDTAENCRYRITEKLAG